MVRITGPLYLLAHIFSAKNQSRVSNVYEQRDGLLTNCKFQLELISSCSDLDLCVYEITVSSDYYVTSPSITSLIRCTDNSYWTAQCYFLYRSCIVAYNTVFSSANSGPHSINNKSGFELEFKTVTTKNLIFWTNFVGSNQNKLNYKVL